MCHHNKVQFRLSFIVESGLDSNHSSCIVEGKVLWWFAEWVSPCLGDGMRHQVIKSHQMCITQVKRAKFQVGIMRQIYESQSIPVPLPSYLPMLESTSEAVIVVRREPRGSSSATFTRRMGSSGLQGGGNIGGKSFTSTIVMTRFPRPTLEKWWHWLCCHHSTVIFYILNPP